MCQIGALILLKLSKLLADLHHLNVIKWNASTEMGEKLEFIVDFTVFYYALGVYCLASLSPASYRL
jgi:hypothetical protein